MAIRKHIGWMLGSQAVLLILQFLGSVVVARLLSPLDLGIYAIAMAISGAVITIQELGLSALIIRDPDLHLKKTRSIFTVNIIISSGVSIVILFLGYAGGAIFNNNAVRQVLLVYAVVPFIGAFEFLPSAVMEREARFKEIAIINFGEAFVLQSITIILVFRGFGYIGLAYGQISASLFTLLSYNVCGRRHVDIRLSLHDWREVATFGIQRLAVNGVNSISIRLSDIILGRICGLAALGIYGRASALNNLLWIKLHLVINRVIFVNLAERARNNQPLRESCLRTIDILTATLWPAFAGLSVVSGPFILAVYGPKWVSASWPLILLCASSIILISLSLIWELFVIRHQTGVQVRIEFSRMCVSVAMFFVGCFFGPTGAAASRLAEAMVFVGIYRPYLNRMAGTRTRDFLVPFWRSAVLTVIAVSPASIVMAAHKGSELTPLGQVLPAILIGFTLWTIAILWSKHPLAEEIQKVFEKLLP